MNSYPFFIKERMQKDIIGIKAFASISAAGIDHSSINNAYFNNNDTFIQKAKHESKDWRAPLSIKSEKSLNNFIKNNAKYKRFDRSTLLALLAADGLPKKLIREQTGVNLGSSRGATTTLEDAYHEFLEYGKVPFLCSPLTTMGNVATNVARHLQTKGPSFSHSITCSTAMQSLINAIQWIKAGSSEQFIVGGTEAPLTKFTIEQMKRLGIYSNSISTHYPCTPLEINKTENNMVLGEGAACFLIEKTIDTLPLAFIDGIGYAMEHAPSITGITQNGLAMQKAMQKAINNAHTSEPIDLIIMHAPGTLNGEQAELQAIQKVFESHIPALYSNKWLIGHTLGASGALSMDLAIRCVQSGKQPKLPYENISKNIDKPIQKVMINTIGFGGNASSAIISSNKLL